MPVIKRVLAYIVTLTLLCASDPAFATGFALIPGTATNGAQTDLAYDASSNLTLHLTSSVPAGSLMLMPMTNTNSGCCSPGFTCTDTKGNSWTSLGFPDAVSAAAIQLMWTVTASSMTTSDSVNCPEIAGGPAGGTVGALIAFSGPNTTQPDASTEGDCGFSNCNSLTIGPTGATTCVSGGSNCALAICVVTWNNWGTIGIDSNYSVISNANANGWSFGYRFLNTTTGGQSCTMTNSASSRSAGQLVIFKSQNGVIVPVAHPLMQSIP